MPFESLSCQRCGSPDIQEVKPETYFCNHCDSVFKYVSSKPTGSAGGCELPAAEKSCEVPAIGHCNTCSRAFCATHQAIDQNHIGVVFQTHRDWCISCQQQRKVDEQNLAEAKQKQRKEERAAAIKRIPILIAQFRARPFANAVNRDYVEQVWRGQKFFSQGDKYRSVTHSYEPAVPLGELLWDYIKVGFDNDPNKKDTALWETGLTQKGELVPMDTSLFHSMWIAAGLGYNLAIGQEAKTCEYLERLLSNASQEPEAAAAQDPRFKLTRDGKVNYADPR